MRRRVHHLVSLTVCGVLLAGCAGGGSGGPSGPGGSQAIVPAGASKLGGTRARIQSGHRLLTLPTCSGSGIYSFVGGGYATVAHGYAATVPGGEYIQACDDNTAIAGGFENDISTGAEDVATDSFIGAGSYNAIEGNNASITSGQSNAITTGFASIDAGELNQVSGPYGAIGAGYTNNVSGQYGFIGSGSNDTVSGNYGFIGSGELNKVTGPFGAVAGGDSNIAEGVYAAVPGGADNVAAGELSLAAGHDSYAAASGSFVWSDFAGGAKQLESLTANEFLARASGGFILYTNPTNTTGVKLAAGSGSWASLSDRTLKTGVTPIDDAGVLDKVAAMPVDEWSYRSEPGVRHLGPMAQDFYAAFNVGEDDRHIATIDEDGVALAAIKALHRQNGDETNAIRSLRRKVADLTTQLAELQRQVAALQNRR